MQTKRAYELSVDDIFIKFGGRFYVHAIEFGKIWYKDARNPSRYYEMSEFSQEKIQIAGKYKRKPQRRPLFKAKSKFAHYGGRCKPIKCVETGEVFPSTRDASFSLGVDQAGISRVVNGKIKSTRGLSFVWAAPVS